MVLGSRSVLNISNVIDEADLLTKCDQILVV
jgi:hypothetical protein